jgi:hypothetical protein
VDQLGRNTYMHTCMVHTYVYTYMFVCIDTCRAASSHDCAGPHGWHRRRTPLPVQRALLSTPI